MRTVTVKDRKLYKYMLPFILMTAFFVVYRISAADVYAASIGSITVDGKTKTYSNFEDLVEDLDDYGNKTVTVEMLTDWNASPNKEDFNRRIHIAKGSKVTLNMHGHIFNRDNVWDDDEDSDGELIYVEPGATLTINGHSTLEEAKTLHKHFRIFTGNDQDVAEGYIDAAGGCLAGGNGDCGTGGIYIDSGKDVVLNNVTIFGCKASHNYWCEAFHSGYGAGIIITEDYSHLYLNNSTITGCYAECYGGGIYADNDPFGDTHHSIDLDNSHIDKNYADDGGGVYFWNDEATLSGDASGFTIEGNRADKGGGVYLEEEDQKIESVDIRGNTANTGGGIFVDNDKTSLSNCRVTGNSKYGVYYENTAKEGLGLRGGTIIKDNRPGNLSLGDEKQKLDISQDDRMNIYMGYRRNPTSDAGYQIASDITVDFSDQFMADDPDYMVAYTYRDKKQDDGRRLRYIFSRCGKGTKCKLIKTINGNKTFAWTKIGLKTKTPYKAYVKGWVMKGSKKKYISISPILHTYTANGTNNYTVARSIKVKKTKVKLMAGKVYKIRAKIIKRDKTKKLMPAYHAKQLRYISTNKKVATVSASGKITAKGKGACTVFAFAHNGISKGIKVTVR